MAFRLSSSQARMILPVILTSFLALLPDSATAQRRPRRGAGDEGMPWRPDKTAADDALTTRLAELLPGLRAPAPGAPLPKSARVLDARIATTGTEVMLSPDVLNAAWRMPQVAELRARFAEVTGKTNGRDPLVLVNGRPLEDFVAPFLKPDRMPRSGPSSAAPRADAPLVRPADPVAPPARQGLAGRHIVVWASHGWYWDGKGRQRWEWQRPRLFTTVEDLLTMSIVNPYLLPMLENAGAVVLNCRERDFQTREVVVDDGDGAPAFIAATGAGAFETTTAAGFRGGMALLPDGVNPHKQGTSRLADSQADKGSQARWAPEFPADGDYGVYVSYPSTPRSTTAARYTVNHAGGATAFLVNQRMAGNTWVWLGSFRFLKGRDEPRGSVVLSSATGRAGEQVGADAVKFGGGMGSVVRGPGPSGYPRYAEGARYWFQYAGIEPALVYAFGGNAGNEYNEDYVSRSEYANALTGAPRGPGGNPAFAGLGVPVDLNVALHTDAGILTGTVGTLAIYSGRGSDGKAVFPDGRDRLLNRDLGDLVQSQIVADIRAKWCSTWERRELRDANYAEARRPNTPAVLLEILSHQNYDDAKFATDPRFKADVARAIYKGALRFLAQENGFEPVVTPLPPDHVAVRSAGAGRFRVSWRPVRDPLEPTAAPTGYVVYARIGAGGFDNGRAVAGATSVEVALPGLKPGEVASFRVTATNSGGQSFPSEVLCAAAGDGATSRALIVNAFDRVAPPAMVSRPGREGLDRDLDRGVGDGWSVGLTGNQHEFDRSRAWAGDDSPFTNDNPGHGASYADLETAREAGNTRDFAAVHGTALAAAGWAFDSASDEAVADGDVKLGEYRAVDWLLGEERTTMPAPAHDGVAGAADRVAPDFACWPPAHQQAVRAYLGGGGRLLVSGAYAVSDLVDSPVASPGDRAFLDEVLGCQYISSRASRTNRVLPANTGGPFAGMQPFHFAAGAGEGGVYGVENPGALEALPKPGPAVLRYADGLAGAAIATDKQPGRRVVFGFPLECVVDGKVRNELFLRAMTFLDR